MASYGLLSVGKDNLEFTLYDKNDDELDDDSMSLIDFNRNVGGKQTLSKRSGQFKLQVKDSKVLVLYYKDSKSQTRVKPKTLLTVPINRVCSYKVEIPQTSRLWEFFKFIVAILCIYMVVMLLIWFIFSLSECQMHATKKVSTSSLLRCTLIRFSEKMESHTLGIDEIHMRSNLGNSIYGHDRILKHQKLRRGDILSTPNHDAHLRINHFCALELLDKNYEVVRQLQEPSELDVCYLIQQESGNLEFYGSTQYWLPQILWQSHTSDDPTILGWKLVSDGFKGPALRPIRDTTHVNDDKEDLKGWSPEPVGLKGVGPCPSGRSGELGLSGHEGEEIEHQTFQTWLGWIHHHCVLLETWHPAFYLTTNSLTEGGCIYSEDKDHHLYMTHNCSLEVWSKDSKIYTLFKPEIPIRDGRECKLRAQRDGNLVLYYENNPLWATNTNDPNIRGWTIESQFGIPNLKVIK